MKKNQKMMISAATLAVLASSLAGACGSQSQSLSQVATDTSSDVDTLATAPADSTAADDGSSSASSGTGSAGSLAAYADGSYTGDAASTRWGDVQVSVTIADGSIDSVQFLSYPDGDPRSAQINAQAAGMLVQEAIQAQSADVQVISGATFTSEAFIQSLDSALSQAV
jgi:uncharacterized protein with FMN-binding domain